MIEQNLNLQTLVLHRGGGSNSPAIFSGMFVCLFCFVLFFCFFGRLKRLHLIYPISHRFTNMHRNLGYRMVRRNRQRRC